MTLSSDEEGSGSMVEILDLGLNGLMFETHRRHCVVFLSNTFSTAKNWFNPGRQKSSQHDYICLFDSLRPINNLSVI